MQLNLLNPMRGIARLFPTVARPITKLNMQQRTVFTAIALFIYLVCSQIPLYGIVRHHDNDPLYWARLIMASSRGTLMELGISPIITAGWLTQLLGAVGLFRVISKQDQKDAQGVECVLAMVFCMGQAVAAIWSGTYGIASQMSFVTMLLIVFQLMGAGLIVILLDDMLRKGYGLGSGISLFICANTSQTIFWFAFSPVTMSSQFGVQFEGAVIALVHFLMTKNSVWQAVYQSFVRDSGYNLSQLLGAFILFLVLIYFHRFGATIKLVSQRYPGWTQQFRIKLFFTSNMSVILQSMIISNFYQVSKYLYQMYTKSVLVKLIGKWDDDRIVGGLLWYVSPPYDLQEAIQYPHRTLMYTVFVCTLCAFLARIWIIINKTTPLDYAKGARARGMTMQDPRRESVIAKCNQVIPIAASLGGIIIGFLTVIGDLLDVAGSSTGILLSISILHGYYDKISRKKQQQYHF